MDVRELEKEYQRVKAMAAGAYESKEKADAEADRIKSLHESVMQQFLEEALAGKSPDLLTLWVVCRAPEIAEEAARTKGMEWHQLSQRVAKLLQQIVSAKTEGSRRV